MGVVRPARFVRFGSFQLDLRAGELRRNGIKIRVPGQSIQVLAILLENPGEAVTREELHQRLWPNGTIVEFDHGINAVINRLRQALEDSANEPRFIETLPRLGYRFILPVEQMAPTETAASEPEIGELAGQTIFRYRILRKLGQGAVGVVYQAEDTTLGRSVAIKFLSKELSDDPQALERFQREARAASALNHPNICTVHEVGEHEDVPFIVMEYVTGKSLDQLIGPEGLPVNKLLNYAVQITDALGRAHSAGIVHRDLKPANIMVSQHGLVKLLDFGLAKVRGVEAVAGMTALPAQTTPLTGEGTILGTLQYMSPEQLEGKEADARTDIFALGAVIYEMATGRKAFEGNSQASLIATIMASEPPPTPALQAMTPPLLDHAVRTCLAKDPEERWQNTRDLATQLRWIAEAGGTPGTAASREPVAKGRKRELLYRALAVICLLAAIISAASYWRLARTPTRTIISEITPPDRVRFNFTGPGGGAPVLSPDGHTLAFPAVDERGGTMLWVRSLDSPAAHPLPGTEGAGDPFWSPDSRALGFFADSKLKTIDASGGPAIVVAAAPADQGGSWNRDGTILFVPDIAKGLYRVPAAGGNPVLVIAVDAFKYVNPRFLPDGKHFLFRTSSMSSDPAALGTYFASLDGKERRLVMRGFGRTAYASGFLLYLREGILMAQAFDPERGQLKGHPHPVAEHMPVDAVTGQFDVSQNGILIYQASGGGTAKRLTWFDRAGKNLGVTGGVADYYDLRLSQDGQKLVANASDPPGSPNSEIWVDELARSVRMRLTIDPDTDHGVPVWSPDSSMIVFGAIQGRARKGIYHKPSNGAGAQELLLLYEKQDAQIWPTSWSSDGRFILYTRGDIGDPSHADIWVLPLEGDRRPRLFVQAVGAYDGQFSPDGRWVSYTSRESGVDEVYVVPFDGVNVLSIGPGSASTGGGGKWKISASGGRCPRWRRDSKEIFYLSPTSQIMAEEVEEKGNSIAVRTAQALFRSEVSYPSFAPYDVTPDGKRFVINVPSEQSSPLTLLVNWTANLKKQ
jgi:serine/threonine protein kinase